MGPVILNYSEMNGEYHRLSLTLSVKDDIICPSPTGVFVFFSAQCGENRKYGYSAAEDMRGK